MTSDDQPEKIRVGDLYWKQIGSNGWVLGKVSAYDADTTTATFDLVDEDSGDVLQPVQQDLINVTMTPIFPSNPLFSTCADMTSLHHLHEAALAKNLQDRSVLSNQRPYTFMANVLIAINPLRYLEEPDKDGYIGQSLDKCPPHPYHVAESAYRQLATVRPVMQNQSIIISGESGSGKTETSKIILDFLTVRAMSHRQSVDDSGNEPEVTRVSVRHAPRVLSSFSSRDAPSSVVGVWSSVTLGDRLMETIPILESFGNAKTHRNHNSSRFGKYMRLQFSSRHHHLTGASIDTYLLEKSRLVHPPMGERNFHIFYELLRSGRVDLLDPLHLTASLDAEHMIASFQYLNRSGCTARSDALDDAANFHKLTDALQLVGIDAAMQVDLFRLVAGVLHLGNVSFVEEETDEGTTACISPGQDALEVAAALLGMQKDLLSSAMLNKRITRSSSSRRNSIYYLKKDIRQATYSRDTIAKTVYELVFTWLMRRCASALEYNEALRDVLPYIGVLDIFGFEDFEPHNRNSFEQLLINYANETLQSIFNTCIFQAEQELYKSEHIHVPNNVALMFPWASTGGDPLYAATTTASSNATKLMADRLNDTSELISYVDNQECLNLMASRSGGVFSTIDAISRLPGPSDKKLNERLHTLFKRHSCFPTPHPKEAHEMFCIVHYAGMVKYHIDSFIDKNNNIISAQFEELMAASKSTILQALPVSPPTSSSSPPNSNNQRGGSVTQMFSVQMRGLASELEGTRCNFIRCIKPNADMEVGKFDRASVVDQLRCSGTVQACSVLRVGLPTRILYAEVVDTYLPVVGHALYEKFNCNERLFTQAICAALAFPTDAYRLGDTRLFFRTGKIDLLDKLLNVTKMEDQMPTMLVNYLVKRRWLSAVTKVMVFKMWERVFAEVRFRRSALTLQCWWRQVQARKERQSLATQARVASMLAKWTKKLKVMKSFEGKPDDKIDLLNKLLAKPVVAPSQKWLLTWLGPLQRAMYVQKLCRKACVAYLAKRGFVWLLQQVKVKRAQLLLQTQVRMVLAKRRLQELVRRRRARDHWRKALFGARMLSIMSRQFRRVHLHRLEQGQIELTAANEALQSQVQHLTAKLDSVEMDKQHLQRLVTSTAASLAEREARLQRLEAKIQSENKESLMLRIFKFFTCSSSSSVSSSRRQRKQSVDEDESECSMTTCTSDESADDVTVQRVRITPPTKKKQQPPRNHVWKVSRFCF